MSKYNSFITVIVLQHSCKSVTTVLRQYVTFFKNHPIWSSFKSRKMEKNSFFDIFFTVFYVIKLPQYCRIDTVLSYRLLWQYCNSVTTVPILVTMTSYYRKREVLSSAGFFTLLLLSWIKVVHTWIPQLAKCKTSDDATRNWW